MEKKILTKERLEAALKRADDRVKANETYNSKRAMRILYHVDRIKALQGAFMRTNVMKKAEKADTLKVPLVELGFNLINTEDSEKKVEVLKRIALYGEEAVNILKEHLESQRMTPKVRAEAARLLGKLRSKEAVRVLKDVLADQTEHKDVRSACAWALGEIGGREAEEVLKKVRDKEQMGVVSEAIGKALEVLEKPNNR